MKAIMDYVRKTSYVKFVVIIFVLVCVMIIGKAMPATQLGGLKIIW